MFVPTNTYILLLYTESSFGIVFPTIFCIIFISLVFVVVAAQIQIDFDFQIILIQRKTLISVVNNNKLLLYRHLINFQLYLIETVRFDSIRCSVI